MDTIKITCTNNGNDAVADVLSRNDKSMTVAVKGTNIRLVLSRTDVRKHYVGNYGSLEFTAK